MQVEETVATEVEQAPPAPKPLRAKPSPVTRPKRQPPHAVILHNDNINRFEWVVGVLIKVFRFSAPRAFSMTVQAHMRGRTVVWSGSLEVAELKADQIHSCGPDPKRVARGAKALGVSIEPLRE